MTTTTTTTMTRTIAIEESFLCVFFFLDEFISK